MTEYRYKWVSIVLGGEPDTLSVEKARKRGWEAVPDDERPVPLDPIDGLTLEQTLRAFALYRMPTDVAEEHSRTLIAKNKDQETAAVRHWLADSHPLMPKFASINEPTMRVIVEPLRVQLERYFSPEMRARYPERQKELDDWEAGPKNPWFQRAIKQYKETNGG